jgi:hypothetical protein
MERLLYQSLDNEIAKTRKHLLEKIELSIGNLPQFSQIRRVILNELGFSGLQGKVRLLLSQERKLNYEQEENCELGR